MFEVLKATITPIRGRCVIQRGEDVYEVRLAERHICSDFILYKVNRGRFFTRKTKLQVEIMELLRADALASGVDVNSADGLVNLAEYFVDEYLDKSARDKSEVAMREAQLEAFCKHRG